MYKTRDFILKDSAHQSDRLGHVITDFPVLALIDTGHPITHVAVSCDGLTLAVAVSLQNQPLIFQYDVQEFATQVRQINAAHEPNKLLCKNVCTSNILLYLNRPTDTAYCELFVRLSELSNSFHAK